MSKPEAIDALQKALQDAQKVGICSLLIYDAGDSTGVMSTANSVQALGLAELLSIGIRKKIMHE